MKRLYAWLLYLLPRSYRLEYGEELQAVFDLSLDEARQVGKAETARVILRELISLPRAIAYQHLRERRNMSGKFFSRFDFVPGSCNEILAGTAPFLLFGAVPVFFSYLDNTVKLPMWMLIAFILILWISVISLYVIGFIRHVPRWFLVYLGLPLPVMALLIFNELMDPNWRGFPFLYRSSWYIRQFVHQGLMWGILILLVILLVLFSMMIPRLWPFYRRIRADWTLLCFLLYGAIPFIIVLLFEEFRNEEPYMILSFLVLAGGAWLYLTSDGPWKKFLFLFSGMTLSMLVTVIGQALLYESSFPFTRFPEWTTTMSTVITWLWLALFMFASLALNLFPRIDNRPLAADAGGTG